MAYNYFVFGGVSCREYGVCIEHCPKFVTGQRVITKQTVPGRSGDLLIDTGAYGNYVQPYEVWFKLPQKNTEQAAKYLARWLLSGRGYLRLEDSYDPEVYRIASFAGPLDVENWMLRYGRATLEFDCKPQRFLKAGEIPVTVQSGQKLLNQWMPALPLIYVVGSGDGQLVVGDSVVDITDMAGGVTLDCDIQNAYNGTLNLNNNITVSGGWPVLGTGQTLISFSGSITSVKITPRWWTL